MGKSMCANYAHMGVSISATGTHMGVSIYCIAFGVQFGSSYSPYGREKFVLCAK